MPSLRAHASLAVSLGGVASTLQVFIHQLLMFRIRNNKDSILPKVSRQQAGAASIVSRGKTQLKEVEDPRRRVLKTPGHPKNNPTSRNSKPQGKLQQAAKELKAPNNLSKPSNPVGHVHKDFKVTTKHHEPKHIPESKGVYPSRKEEPKREEFHRHHQQKVSRKKLNLGGNGHSQQKQINQSLKVESITNRNPSQIQPKDSQTIIQPTVTKLEEAEHNHQHNPTENQLNDRIKEKTEQQKPKQPSQPSQPQQTNHKQAQIQEQPSDEARPNLIQKHLRKKQQDKQQQQAQAKLTQDILQRRRARQQQRERSKAKQQQRNKEVEEAEAAVQHDQGVTMLNLTDQLAHVEMSDGAMDVQVRRLMKMDLDKFDNREELERYRNELAGINQSYQMIRDDENNTLVPGLRNYRVELFNRLGEELQKAQKGNHQNFRVMDVDNGLNLNSKDFKITRGIPNVDQVLVKKKNTKVEDCAICLNTIKDNEMIRQIECGHRFHVACLDSWVENSGNCPSCRYNIKFGNR